MEPKNTPLAELNEVQLEALSAMEKELGVVLIAYESEKTEK